MELLREVRDGEDAANQSKLVEQQRVESRLRSMLGR
jgi:hypothetical protein